MELLGVLLPGIVRATKDSSIQLQLTNSVQSNNNSGTDQPHINIPT